jgi:starvation-inducible outer membrane lipoprotein
MAKSVFALACAVLLTACPMPPPASERATDAAREANVAARFGRIDIAAGATTAAARSDFLRRRAMWGGDIRIVDVELGGLSMPDSDHAIFEVDYAWMRMNEDTLRSTRITQRWTSTKGAWVLESEKRAAGDIGLFGEHVEVLRPRQRDAQFATKVIRED